REARRRARRALAMARAVAPRFEPGALRALAQSMRMGGRPAAAERVARRAFTLAVRRAPAEERQWCRVELARVMAARRRWDEVAELADAGAHDPGAEGGLPAAWL